MNASVPDVRDHSTTNGNSNTATGERLCDLVEAIADRRDKGAFAELFTYFAPRLKAYVIAGNCAEADADELVQDTMITLWRRAATFDRRKAKASTWLYTIVRNKRIDRVRREKFATVDLREAEQVQDDLPDPANSVDAARAAACIRDSMSLLSHEQIAVIQKAFFEDKSHSVLAKELGMPIGTVKSRIRSALRLLRNSPIRVFA